VPQQSTDEVVIMITVAGKPAPDDDHERKR